MSNAHTDVVVLLCIFVPLQFHWIFM